PPALPAGEIVVAPTVRRPRQRVAAATRIVGVVAAALVGAAVPGAAATLPTLLTAGRGIGNRVAEPKERKVLGHGHEGGRTVVVGGERPVGPSKKSDGV